MQAGQRNRLLYLQKPTRSINSATGAPSLSWTNIGNVWAKVTPASGAESNQFNQPSSIVTHKVETLFRNDINAGYRFLFGLQNTALNGAINDVTTSVVVDDAAVLGIDQARRDRVLKVGNELMTIDSVSSNTLTVTRGAFGTSAAAHSDGDNAILYRQLNILAVHEDNGRRASLTCDCREVA